MSEDRDLLRELYMESSRKIEEGLLRLEAKIDHLHTCVEARHQQIDEKLNNHEQRIIKHEQTFSLTGTFLSVLGGLVGLVVATLSIFPWNQK